MFYFIFSFNELVTSLFPFPYDYFSFFSVMSYKTKKIVREKMLRYKSMVAKSNGIVLKHHCTQKHYWENSSLLLFFLFQLLFYFVDDFICPVKIKDSFEGTSCFLRQIILENQEPVIKRKQFDIPRKP
uniref:Uncharacterized protein n=1 Tax=Cacopsylla melanoneura TaxID=428564 RepID=A0A8D8PTC4_9HEMI